MNTEYENALTSLFEDETITSEDWEAACEFEDDLQELNFYLDSEE